MSCTCSTSPFAGFTGSGRLKLITQVLKWENRVVDGIGVVLRSSTTREAVSLL